MLKICEYCGKEFEAVNSNSKFCSRECNHKNMTTKIECICDTCGAKVMRKPSDLQGKKNIFCSKECYKEYAYEIIICKKCGKEFKARKSLHKKYCSNNCKNACFGKNQKTNRENIICKYCGKEFESQISSERIYCSENCFRNAQKTGIIKIRPDAKNRIQGKNHFYDSIKDWDQNIELLEEYITMNTKIKCRCKKHNKEFLMAPIKMMSGQTGCISCIAIKSKGEEKIKSYLDSIKCEYNPQYSFEDCKNINCLPFDFYIPKLNIAIEYDGEHHYRPWKHSKNQTDEDAMREFQDIKKRDSIKTTYCKDNDIKLIRIPYFDYDNIETILSTELVS